MSICVWERGVSLAGQGMEDTKKENTGGECKKNDVKSVWAKANSSRACDMSESKISHGTSKNVKSLDAYNSNTKLNIKIAHIEKWSHEWYNGTATDLSNRIIPSRWPPCWKLSAPSFWIGLLGLLIWWFSIHDFVSTSLNLTYWILRYALKEQ